MRHSGLGFLREISSGNGIQLLIHRDFAREPPEKAQSFPWEPGPWHGFARCAPRNREIGQKEIQSMQTNISITQQGNFLNRIIHGASCRSVATTGQCGLNAEWQGVGSANAEPDIDEEELPGQAAPGK